MDFDVFVEQMHDLRKFQGSESEFWSVFLQAISSFFTVESSRIYSLDLDKQEIILQNIFPQDLESPLKGSFDFDLLSQTAGQAWDKGFIAFRVSGTKNSTLGDTLIGFRCCGYENNPDMVLILGLKKNSQDLARVGAILKLIRDVPQSAGNYAQTKQQGISNSCSMLALDSFIFLQKSNHFKEAAFGLCNDLAAKLGCSRVSLGWVKKHKVRVEALSHVENFDRKTFEIKQIQQIMEEAAEQMELVRWPVLGQEKFIFRTHEQYARKNGLSLVLTSPIMLEDKVIAVLSFESQAENFDAFQLEYINTISNSIGIRVEELYAKNRWFGIRFFKAITKILDSFFSFKNSLYKLIFLIIAAVLIAFPFIEIEYEVEGPCILTTDTTRHVSAPFSGYVEDINVFLGDSVQQEEKILTLETKDILLEQAETLAEHNRNIRSMEKARAENALADMRIAQARIEQTKSKLERISYLLERANIKSPINGFIVSGDRKKLLGAPVQKGDILFKIARYSDLYIEIDIEEQDIHEIYAGMPGRISFLSRPEKKFDIKVDRISPVALVKQGKGNIFIVRGDLISAHAPWWRPGMSGLAKLEVGKRPLYWIIFHRAIDFFLLKFWW